MQGGVGGWVDQRHLRRCCQHNQRSCLALEVSLQLQQKHDPTAVLQDPPPPPPKPAVAPTAAAAWSTPTSNPMETPPTHPPPPPHTPTPQPHTHTPTTHIHTPKPVSPGLAAQQCCKMFPPLCLQLLPSPEPAAPPTVAAAGSTPPPHPHPTTQSLSHLGLHLSIAARRFPPQSAGCSPHQNPLPLHYRCSTEYPPPTPPQHTHTHQSPSHLGLQLGNTARHPPSVCSTHQNLLPLDYCCSMKYLPPPNSPPPPTNTKHTHTKALLTWACSSATLQEAPPSVCWLLPSPEPAAWLWLRPSSCCCSKALCCAAAIRSSCSWLTRSRRTADDIPDSCAADREVADDTESWEGSLESPGGLKKNQQ